MGGLAFFLFFLGDFNDLRLHKKWMRFCFPAGVVLLTLSVILQLNPSAAPVQSLIFRVLILIAALIFAALEIYSLFFSFPVEEAYASPGEKRQSQQSGIYALCRHPGVLWLFLLFLCLWLALGFSFFAFITYSLLNVLLVVYEDAVVFPSLLFGYHNYKARTPFILPTPASIKAVFSKNKGIESDENEIPG